MEFDPETDARQRLEHKDVVIGDYLHHVENGDWTTQSDAILAADIADQLFVPGKPLKKTVVIIPVAAASEQTTIGHAIDEYARQAPKEPFTIVLGLNIDTDKRNAPGADSPAVTETLGNLEVAKRRHPGLDIRSSFIEYNNPRIGKIRRDLWNGVLMLYRSEGISPTQEMIGINHDIDVVHIPRLYINAIQRRYANSIRAVDPAYAQTRHAWDKDHPNTSKAVFWNDFYNLQTDTGYEAGAVIPMSFYTRKGGFEALRKTHEVGSLTQGETPLRLIRTGNLQTSPRRFIDRLPSQGLTRIWTPDTFTSEDACRDPDYIADRSDLDKDDLIRVLAHGVSYNMGHILEHSTKLLSLEMATSGALDEVPSRQVAAKLILEQVTERLERTLRLANRVLDSCMPDGVLPIPPEIRDIKYYSREAQIMTNSILNLQYKIHEAMI